jgi:ABC-type transport system involved in cytochrome bd biosynthesis fused ATPase/permease subunit
MFQWLRDLLGIYAWKELWLVVSVPTAVMGVWFLFCFLLTIRIIIIRAIAIWSLLFILTLGSATVDALRKKQAKKES